jgi:hypothetical protein
MLSIPHGSVRASTPARDGSMLEIESGRTVAPSETTGATLPSGAAPLSPARDPVNAGRTVRVEWGGRCHACQAPIWAATWPGTRQQAPPPALSRLRRGAGLPGLARPPGSVGRHRNPGEWGHSGLERRPLGDPPKQRGFDTGFVTPRTPPGARRGGRPRIYSESAARQRAYRARRRSEGPRPSPVAGSPSVHSGRVANSERAI